MLAFKAVWRRLLILVAVAIPIAGVSAAARDAEPPPVRIEPPLVAPAGAPLALKITAIGHLPAAEMPFEITDEAGNLVATGTIRAADETSVRFVPAGDSPRFDLKIVGHDFEPASFRVRTIPGWWTLVPALLAIALAITFRQVIPALFAGVWLGAWITYGSFGAGFLRALDTYVVGALADPDHVAIVIFTLLLGGMVGVISRCGGTRGMVNALGRWATDGRRGQVVTWLLGLLVFFDDYANTLVVGNTMRPVTDRLRVSREKLAYIVDSTAAPVACIALISTWIGFEVSLISDALKSIGSDAQPYAVFVQSIPHCFYPLLALVFVLMVAVSGRDFGPMLRAESRAAEGKLVADGAVPLADFDDPAISPVEGSPLRWLNMVAPVFVVLLVAFASQLLTGRSALLAEGDPLARVAFLDLGLRGLGRVFSSGNSFHALLYGSVCGCLAALVLARAQGILALEDGLRAWIGGVKTMTLAIVILTLAWAIGKICVDLDTAGYVVSALSGRLDPRLLPTLIFIIGALVSFSTGTSWGTMSILVPIAVPSAFGVAEAAGYGPAEVHLILLGSVASVLAGAIFGDHCSPISDTTILSSMASGCDHVDHVKTQLPYAVLVALVGIAAGSLPTGFGVPVWISLPVGVLLLWGALRWLGRRRSGGQREAAG